MALTTSAPGTTFPRELRSSLPAFAKNHRSAPPPWEQPRRSGKCSGLAATPHKKKRRTSCFFESVLPPLRQIDCDAVANWRDCSSRARSARCSARIRRAIRGTGSSPICRGHHQRVDKIGDEPVPRIALRILAEQRAERARLEQSLQFATASQSIWRNSGRTDSKKQDVLL